MIYDHRRDSHDALPTVLLYACPNLNAEYTADHIDRYRWTGDYPECAVCGKTRGIDGVHHEPPRSKGSLLLQTPLGGHVVKPTLMTLCRECHRDRHDRALLNFAWEFDSPEDELAFLMGDFFIGGYAEHDERFWRHGRLLVESRGMRWEVRK